MRFCVERQLHQSLLLRVCCGERLSAILPAKENTRSDDTDVAGMHRYRLAKYARRGKRDSLAAHQVRGSLALLTGLSRRYVAPPQLWTRLHLLFPHGEGHSGNSLGFAGGSELGPGGMTGEVPILVLACSTSRSFSASCPSSWRNFKSLNLESRAAAKTALLGVQRREAKPRCDTCRETSLDTVDWHVNVILVTPQAPCLQTNKERVQP